MKKFISIGIAASMAVATIGIVPAAQAAPVRPVAIQDSMAGSNPVIQVRERGPYIKHGPGRNMVERDGGRRWSQGNGNRRWANQNNSRRWVQRDGGRRWSNNNKWRGRGWANNSRPYRSGWYGPGYGGGYNGYGPGIAAGIAIGALATAPLYAGNCGYVSVPAWSYGQQVWVREYRCSP